ncbi:hypothetical protein [Jatrophihabitans sp.]|uniref:hypothetical protein n=1 Tax=Jatrophihabitans sp. TaxID=1932789 RepID=UPI002EE46ED7
MRAFLSSTLAACAAMLLLAPITSASAAPVTRLQIERTTSAIWQTDPSIEGTGPLYDAVTVYVQLRNCPTGFYYLHMDFIQDGVSYELESRALGVGELNCTGGRVTETLMGFLGNGLHPGPASVIAFVTRSDGTTLAEGSRTVRIPAGYNQP